MTDKASIWYRDEAPGYDRSKKNIGFTTWRILVMERLAEKTQAGKDDAVRRLHDFGLEKLGLAYEDCLTAEELADKLAEV